MRGTRYTAECTAEAIKQITERGHGVVEVSKRKLINVYDIPGSPVNIIPHLSIGARDATTGYQ